jgi:hypothetical protein
MEVISKIINNQAVGNCLYNLYDRWRDEEGYEDINEYGKVIHSVIVKNFPDNKIELVKATKRPFGVKLKVEGTDTHIFTKMKGYYIQVCAKTSK